MRQKKSLLHLGMNVRVHQVKTCLVDQFRLTGCDRRGAWVEQLVLLLQVLKQELVLLRREVVLACHQEVDVLLDERNGRVPGEEVEDRRQFEKKALRSSEEMDTKSLAEHLAVLTSGGS